MLNHIDIMGRLVRDPELRYTQSNIPVCTFSIACERDFSAGGEKQTDFFNVTAWRTTAEFISKYFTKGRMIAVTGRLQTRNYDDKDGNKRTAVEIVADSAYFGDSKSDNASAPVARSNGGAPVTRTERYDSNTSRSGNGFSNGGGYGDSSGNFREIYDDDGDLPF